MQELGAEKVFVDKASGKNVNRPQLNEMLAFARQGDTIVVESLSLIHIFLIKIIIVLLPLHEGVHAQHVH